MGASESAVINVNFNRSNAFYYAGEKLTGNVSFQNIQNKLKIEEILLELIGELGYPTQQIRWRRDTKGRSHKEPYTDCHRVTFLKVPVSIVRSVHRQKKLTLRESSYSIPFELSLPDCLPPTLISSSPEHPYVKYYTRLTFDKPWSSLDTIPTYSLIICPRVPLFHMGNAEAPVEFTNHNRKKIQLNGSILRGGILPGQNLSIQLDLTNPKQHQIKRIEATFIQHRQIANIRDQQIIFNCNLPGIYQFQEPILKQVFDLSLPTTYLPPTYEFTTTHNNSSFGIFIHYELILAVKTVGIFSDFQVSVPVMVGTESLSDRPQQQQFSDQFSKSAMVESILDQNGSPPSYEMAMRNELK
ncbi:unnamed protein product [Rotaria socialis]|uniref:Arrestin C-terminal-like domain-containing protein n=1 Tax=Rotaria socialis TaxID=392032 RepID=A0A818QRR4_9BILA|nr:unnamed protein product [Rotaria socialis]CAF4719358.1 unnamed protein product [Rotaria socialis]